MAKTVKKGGLADPVTQKLVIGGFIGFLVLLFLLALVIQISSPGSGEEADPVRELLDKMGGEDSPKKGARDPLAEGLAKYQSSSTRDIVDGMSLMLAADKQRATPYIQSALASPYPIVRQNAAALLQKHGIKGSGPLVARLVSDADANVRSAASSAVKAFKDENVMGGVADAMESRDPAVAIAAIELWKSLHSSNPRDGLRAIRGALRSRDAGVVNSALGASRVALDAEDKERIRPDVESIARNFAGTSAGEAASKYYSAEGR